MSTHLKVKTLCSIKAIMRWTNRGGCDMSITSKEFIYERCDEILANDKVTKDISDQIVLAENSFMDSLDPIQLKAYLVIESLSILQKEYEGGLLYENGLKDGE